MAHTRGEQRDKRRKHIRKILSGTATKPRLSIFRSNRFLFAQVLDDSSNRVLAAMLEKKVASAKEKGEKPVARAARFGEIFGAALVKKKVTHIVFDRGGYAYHGKVQAFADGVRKAGVKF